MSILKPSKPAKSIVVKVTGVTNEGTFFNFFMWSRVMMLNSPVLEAKMSISGDVILRSSRLQLWCQLKFCLSSTSRAEQFRRCFTQYAGRSSQSVSIVPCD